MNLTAVKRDEGGLIRTFPPMRARRLGSSIAEPHASLIPVLGSKAVYEICAETFSPLPVGFGQVQAAGARRSANGRIAKTEQEIE